MGENGGKNIQPARFQKQIGTFRMITEVDSMKFFLHAFPFSRKC